MAINNEYARLWARQVRGLTIAEHAVLSVLADYYDRSTGRCRIVLNHLVWRFEMNRVYVRQIIKDIQKKGLLRANDDVGKLTDVTEVRLNLDQWFPSGPALDLGRRLLKTHVRDIATDRELAKGFSDAWVEELPKRRNRKAKPVLFVCVASPQHFEQLQAHTTDLKRQLKTAPPFREYNIIAVKTYADRRSEDGVLF